MLEAQGYQILPSGEPQLPEGTLAKTAVPPEMVPYCPKCGRPMTMNLRSDGSFVEDNGWREAADVTKLSSAAFMGGRCFFWRWVWI